MYRYATGRETENSNIIRIASEGGNVFLYPLKGGDLVHIGVTALGLFRMLSTQCRECKMTEAPKPVVEGHQDDTLFGKFISCSTGIGAASTHKSASVDPHH